jgi:protoporphyrinogen/coproporphyrinogen III oxidase
MDIKSKSVVILGAGVSGLSTAYWLEKAGYQITVLESGSTPGGTMVSVKEDGFLIDYGPNSGLETTPLISMMVRGLGLDDRFIYADATGDRRYILRDGRLHALPMKPGAFLASGLFSTGAKLRVMMEPFIGRSEDGYYQSISQFVTRRLGREFLDYVINPFVSGVYAGDPDKLSVKSAFPKLYRLEEVYGGLFKGMIKGAKERKNREEQSKQNAKMFSFRDGMQSLPKAISDKLGRSVKYNCDVDKVLKAESGYDIVFNYGGRSETMSADIVISALPAYNAAHVFRDMDEELCGHLNNIFYPPVKVLYLVYQKEEVGQTLDGFGFLIPAVERKTFLGAIWSSVIFPSVAKEGFAAFTLFVGGARSPEMFDRENETVVDRVLAEFKRIMKIKGDPKMIREKLWPRAIPQYNLGHIEHERYFENFETRNPGIFLSGNYRGGVSVGDCVKNSELTFGRVCDYIGQQ